MRLDIILNFGYCYNFISVSPGFKGCIIVKCCNYLTILALIIFAFTHLVIMSTLLTTIYKKSHCVIIL